MRARSLALSLLAVAALGIAMRLAPLASFAVWGSDTGEYHRIASQLLADGRLSTDYEGWGIAYPWFPGLYAVAAGLSAMTGLDLRATLELGIPALAGLAAVGGGLVAYRVARRGEAALLAGAALAVAMPQAFATSHAMPGALGHLLLLAAVLLAWRTGEDRAFAAGLAVAVVAIVATHHLSTYMLLVALGGMVAVPALLRSRASGPVLLATLAFALALAAAWWAWAKPVGELIVPHASALGLAGLAALAFGGVGLLAVLPRVRSRWRWRFRPRHPSTRGALRFAALMSLLVAATSATVGLIRVPGTTVQVTPLAVLWFLPLAILLGFGLLGVGLAKFRLRGVLLYGWALGLLGAFAVAMAAGSTVLLPYRHAEYILEPAAILTGIGLAATLAAAGPRRTFAVLGVMALLVANAATAYPPPSVLAGFQEGTTTEEMQAVGWARDRIRLAPDATIAADHRMGSMLFGYGDLNATWEYAPLTFQAASFETAKEEMLAVHTPSGVKRVDYVFLSQPMRESLALSQWEQAKPLSHDAQSKFDSDPHYVALCRSPQVVVYRVAWQPGEGSPQPGPCAP